jgi:NADH-quinone oxidoreductase subunit G
LHLEQALNMTIKLPDPAPLVTVTVNGAEMQLPKGKNLLQALLDVGQYVPHYCYHPALSVAGSCRMCLIEIVGRPKPEVSCNMTVTDGLKINTEGPMVESCRKGMMEFLLVNHPLDCPICDRGGECMLQRYSVAYGAGHARTTDDRRRFVKPQFDPLIDIERNRCIMCTRCVRFCDEVGGEHVMGVFGHGDRNYIGTYGNGPVSNAFSGNVIDLCPVGCLTSKPFRFNARAWELRQTLTTTRACNGPVCAWTRDGKLCRVTPPPRRRNGTWTIDEDTTRFLSNEARFGSLYANSPERLLAPRVKKGGQWVEASWETALETAAEVLRAAGPGEACFLAGERSTNEEFYLLSRLARQLCKTPNVDWRMRWTSPDAARVVGAALAASNGDFDLLAQGAYGATLVIGADLLGGAPDIALQFREAARLKKTRLALLDARLDPWISQSATLLALEAPEKLAEAVGKLAEAVLAGGPAPEGYENLYKLLTSQPQGLVAVGLDYNGGALVPALVPAAARLAAALGEGWHFLPLTAARNAKGAFASGGQSDRLATGPVTDGAARSRMTKLWGGGVMALPVGDETPTAPDLLRKAAEGAFKVLFLHRCDELAYHPQRALIEKALAATPTVIAIDVFPSWVNERASVVLPGAVFYETDGTMTDIDGELQRMTQGARPAGQAQEDWRVLESLADLLGAPRRYRKAQEVFADLTSAWGAPKTVKFDDLLLPGPGTMTPQVHHAAIAWKTKPGFKVHHDDATIAVHDGPALAAPAAGSLRLLWIRHAQGPDHLGSRSEEFDALRPRPKIELTPADAARLGLAEGDWAKIENGGSASGGATPGTGPCQVALNGRLAEGVAYGAANVLGLILPADAAGLVPIKLVKTAAPAAAQPARRNSEEVKAGR